MHDETFQRAKLKFLDFKSKPSYWREANKAMPNEMLENSYVRQSHNTNYRKKQNEDIWELIRRRTEGGAVQFEDGEAEEGLRQAVVGEAAATAGRRANPHFLSFAFPVVGYVGE